MQTFARILQAGGPLAMAAIVVAGLASLAVVAGLIHSFVGRSRSWTLGWASGGLVGGLIAGLIAWFGARQGQALIQAALAGAGDSDRTLLALRGHYEIMQGVELTLWGLLLPLGLGAFLLVRGLMLPRGDGHLDEAKPGSSGRGALYASVGCIVAGCGLGLWAIADVNHFGAYVMALLMSM